MTVERWYSAREVAALLGISQRTFFRIAWFRLRKHYATETAVRYTASDVATYQHTRRAA